MLNFIAQLTPEASVATISITRGAVETIYEAVTFEVTDFGEADITTGSFEAYEPAWTEIGRNAKWTITCPEGEADSWVAPERLTTAQKNRKVAYGNSGFFIPTTAGEYTIEFESWDKSGTPISGSGSFTVKALEDVYTSARTFILYDGSDLTGAPTHDVANRYTDYNSARDAFFSSMSSGHSRLAILGGDEYTVADYFGTRDKTYCGHVGSYGTGRAICNVPVDKRFFFQNGTGGPGMTFNGLDVIGTWDATTEIGGQPNDLFSFQHDVAYSGGERFSMSDMKIAGGNKGILVQYHTNVFAEDVEFADHLDFSIYHERTDWSGFRGCKFEDDPACLAGGRRYTRAGASVFRNNHSHIRTAYHGNYTVDGCTFFGQRAWTYNGNFLWVAFQQMLRINTSGEQDPRLNMQRSIVEGSMSVGSLADSTQYPGNILIAKNYFMGTCNSTYLELKISGSLVCDNIFVQPDTGPAPGANINSPQIWIASDVSSTPTNNDPVVIEGNTVIDERTGTLTWDGFINVSEAFTSQTVRDNLEYAPNYDTPYSSDGALSGTATYTAINEGTKIGYTNHEVTVDSDIANGNSSDVFPWFNDNDGVAVDETTFSGGAGYHELFIGHPLGYPENFYHDDGGNGDGTGDILFTLTSSGVQWQNVSGGTIAAGDYYLQLDRRHNLAGYATGTATPASAGKVYRPSSDVTPAGTPSKIQFDLSLRTGSSKGALEAA